MSRPNELDATCGHDTCSHRGTYRLKGKCSNCSWQGIVVLTRGHEAGREWCPRCDCKTVRCGGWA